MSWRMVSIFIAFGKTTGHEHPDMKRGLQNYRDILVAMGLSEKDADTKIEAKLRGDDEQ